MPGDLKIEKKKAKTNKQTKTKSLSVGLRNYGK